MHWLCKLFGHDFTYEPPLIYCQRCGEYMHNPFQSGGAGVKNTDAEIRDGVWSDSNKAPGANIDATISSRSSHSLADVEGEIQDETGAPSADNQTLYDILANADQGTLTTSGDSIADRIDDYVSNAGVNPAIVRREAGVQGWAQSFQYVQPDEVATSTTGGGSVTFEDIGAKMTAGTTSGDTAKLKGLDLQYTDYVDLIKLVAVITSRSTTPPTDDVEIGICRDGVNTDAGAYLDFTAQQYHAGYTTTAATVPAGNEPIVLVVEIDYAAGESRFEQRGAVNETATIADTNPPEWVIAQLNSNGGGEIYTLNYVKEIIIGSK